MGTLFSALDIAQSGLQAAQIQMDVAGHNIANVNNEDFSRQRVTLAARYPNYKSYGALGRGVAVLQIERVRDLFLDTVIRQQAPSLGSATVRSTYFERIEDIFQEPSEDGLSTQINDFFDALNDFANSVEESAVRQSVVTEAENLASTLQGVYSRLNLLRTNANEEARNMAPQINSLSERIAALNTSIRDIELSTGVSANDLRDTRDALVDELSGLVNITARERTDGQVDILIGNDVLVAGDNFRELTAVRNSALDPERSDLVEIRFADNNGLVDVRSGELYGALSIRDSELVNLSGRIDQIAASIIEQVNRIHSQSNGLTAYSTIASTNPVSDATTALMAAGLPFNLSTGSFDIVVYDTAGNPTSTTIAVDNTTTLQSLAADLNAVAGLGASVAADGVTLELSADASNTFVFANDTSGVLTALGINGLFTGFDAGSIAVNADILDNVSLLSSAYSLDALETGDNTAALALADVRNALVLDGGAATLNDYYESTIVQVGINASGNQDLLDVETAFVEDFKARRQEVSGVSLDEEVTNLVQYQRAYEASARVISIANNMFDALMNMG